MIFNRHSEYKGLHAGSLSPSKHHWTNYSDDKFDRVFVALMEAQRGTKRHEYAQMAIDLKIKQRANGSTISLYINDAIGFRMKPEVVLFYSHNAFGSCDAIAFRNNTLRIFDLKTGITPTSFRQLECYVALFCLEYDFSPNDIKVILRIYQNNAFKELIPDPIDIMRIKDRYITFDRRINELRKDAEQ